MVYWMSRADNIYSTTSNAMPWNQQQIIYVGICDCFTFPHCNKNKDNNGRPKSAENIIFTDNHCSQTTTLHDYHVTVYVHVLTTSFTDTEIMETRRVSLFLTVVNLWLEWLTYLLTSACTSVDDNTVASAASAVIDQTASTASSQHCEVSACNILSHTSQMAPLAVTLWRRIAAFSQTS